MIRADRFISAKEVAAMLGIARQTVLNKGGGTRHLTRIKLPDSNQVKFLESEVLAYQKLLIDTAKEQSAKRLCPRCGR